MFHEDEEDSSHCQKVLKLGIAGGWGGNKTHTQRLAAVKKKAHQGFIRYLALQFRKTVTCIFQHIML